MQRMGGQDAAFLYGETASWHMQVSALMTVDPSTAPGGFDFERLKALTVARLPIVPQFRWKLVDVPFMTHSPAGQVLRVSRTGRRLHCGMPSRRRIANHRACSLT